MLVHRAEEAGFKAICLGADGSVPSPKERDTRNKYLRAFPPGNFRGMSSPLTEGSGVNEGLVWDSSLVAPLAWKELEWLPHFVALVLKGIKTAEDAHLAVEHGVDGIQVSTHGGRQMDMTMGAIEMVPEIVEAVKGRAELYLDSGVLRGSDVVKGLGLGCPGGGHRAASVLGSGRGRCHRRPRSVGAAARGDRPMHGLLRTVEHSGVGARSGEHPQWLGVGNHRALTTVMAGSRG